MATAEKRGRFWRVKYQLPDGTRPSESGFETKKAALNWGRAEEAKARHPELGDGYKAAVINYGFLANALLTTDDAVKAMT